MSRFSYVAGAVIVAAFSGHSFANDPGQPTSGAAATARQSPSAAAAAQCDSVVGAQREQCEREARQRLSTSGNTTGATSGGAAGVVGNGAGQTQVTPSGGAASPVRP